MSAPDVARLLGRILSTLAFLAAPLAVAACSGPAAAPTASPSPSTSLTITYTADGDKPDDSVTWTLTCGPDGGTHPDPAGACAALESNGSKALPPVPGNAACTMIYGGPNTATVKGTWKGDSVDASFNLSGGCEIDRWKSLQPLLPATTN